MGDGLEPATKARASQSAVVLHRGQQLEKNLLRDVFRVRRLEPQGKHQSRIIG